MLSIEDAPQVSILGFILGAFFGYNTSSLKHILKQSASTVCPLLAPLDSTYWIRIRCVVAIVTLSCYWLAILLSSINEDLQFFIVGGGVLMRCANMVVAITAFMEAACTARRR